LSLCPSCGKEIPWDSIYCPHCRFQIKEAPAPVAPVRNIDIKWWLLPILLSTFGGVIAFLANRHANPRIARYQLILGIILVIEIPLAIFFYIYITGIFSMFSRMP
jgi:hypothetical protein